MGVAAAVIGGVASLGGAVAGGIANNKANKKTNQTSMEIAQMNNEFNAAEAEKNRVFQTDMYDKAVQNQWDMFNATNEYNSAANQRKRLEDAGLNPALAMSGQNAGTAQAVGGPSSPSGVAASSAGNPTLTPNKYDFSSIAGSIMAGLEMENEFKNSAAERTKTIAEANQVNIENQYRAQKLLNEIEESRLRQKDTGLKNQYQEMMNNVFDSQWQSEQNLRVMTAENMRATYQGIITQNSISALQLQNLPQEQAMQLALGWSEVALNDANKNKSKEELKVIAQNYLESKARTLGIKMDNWIKDKSAENLVENSYWTMVRARNNTGGDNIFQTLNNDAKNVKSFGIYLHDRFKNQYNSWSDKYK